MSHETMISNSSLGCPNQPWLILHPLRNHRATSGAHLVASRASTSEHRRQTAEAPLATRLLVTVARATVVDASIRLVLFTAAVVAPVATRAFTTSGRTNEVLATARACRATDKVVVTVAQAAAHEAKAAHAVSEFFRVPVGASGSRLIDFGCCDVVSDDLVFKEERTQYLH
jgi:hypothetical protein